MFSSLPLIALFVVSGVLAREIPGLEDFPDIKKIRTREPKEINLEPSSALNVLSHLTQAQAVGPRRRSFSPRVGLPQPLPLEPRPHALPPKVRPQTSELYPEREEKGEFSPYRPRPEVKKAETQTFNHQQSEEPVELKENVGRQEPSLELKRRRPRPSAYIEDDTLYRKPSVEQVQSSDALPERPAIVQDKPVQVYKDETPVYSKRRPAIHGQKYVPKTVFEVREPVFVSKSTKVVAKHPQPVFPTKTRHRNRPQYSENVASEEPEVVTYPVQVEAPKYSEQPELFDFPKQNLATLLPERESTRDVFRPTKVKSILKPSSSAIRRRRPQPLSDYSRPAPTKVSKKKKFSRQSFDKDPKKDKRAVHGGTGHLDQNGVEFLAQSQKAQRGRSGRIAFQMHGLQGPHSYRFGFDTGKGANRQFRYEERDGKGQVKGRYGYYDKHGKLQIVNYSAHPKYGFTADVPKY